MNQYRVQLERRRRNIRLILGAIIVITLPFYCAGLILWGTAPQRNVQVSPFPATNTPMAVHTAVTSATATFIGLPSITPFPITITVGLPPTFTFPTPLPTIMLPTRFLSPTPTFLPPTPFPTNPPPTVPPVPTDTPVPLPFDTPLPP